MIYVADKVRGSYILCDTYDDYRLEVPIEVLISNASSNEIAGVFCNQNGRCIVKPVSLVEARKQKIAKYLVMLAGRYDRELMSSAINFRGRIVNGRAPVVPVDCTGLSQFIYPDCDIILSLRNMVGKVVFESSLKFIHTDMIDSVGVSSIVFTGKIVEIQDKAFNSCWSLKEIVNLWGTKRIGKYAFASCVSLKQVELPSTVCTVDTGAFQNCKSLVTVNLNNADCVGKNAFKDCKSLKNICNMQGTNIDKSAFDGTVFEMK